jgi:adenylate cyclase
MPRSAPMTLPRIERRLAAILAADVAGYSRLMGADEVGTLTALKTHRRERIDPAIARHNGRIVKTTGDGLLVEFASVVDAVGCAVAIQRAMLASSVGIHADRQIILRIGINVGDIIIDGGDIFGDGVNVAARLEALCEPGGVCISRSANEQVRDRLSLSFADLGEQTVKNIARAVGVFGLAPHDIAALPDEALPQPESPEPPGQHAPARPAALVAGTVAVVAILATGGWWMLRDRASPPVAAAVAPAAPRPAPFSPQDRRQSVIVLPFENSSGDPAQDAIAASITRDVTSLIASDSAMPLVPAVTAAGYLGKTLDLRQIGREHNVHFVLSGNARRQDARLIGAASLYDAATARQEWAENFDQPEGPDAQHSIVQRIYGSVWQAGIDAEAASAMREHPESLDQRDLMNAYLRTSLTAPNKANYQAKGALLGRALTLDPNFRWALERQARLHAERVMLGYSSDPAADLAIAQMAVDKMLQTSPNSQTSLRAKAFLLRAQGNWDEAEAVLRRVIDMTPLEGNRRTELGTVLMAKGRHEEGLESFLTAKRFAAGNDPVYLIDANIANALLANDRFPESIAQARLAISEFPPNSGRIAEYPWLALIAAESENGQHAEARADLQKFLATERTLRTMAEIQKLPLLAANPKLLEGLRGAGMPEE